MAETDPSAFERALDAWIAERRDAIAAPEVLDREQATRQLAAEALRTMGLLPVGL